jgi:uncharacterized protein (DUF1330 family)
MTATETPHIEPTEQQVDALVAAAQDAAGPVVMINLLAFNDQGGRASYERYAQEVAPHLQRVGAEIVYAGNAAQVVIGGQDRPWWDAIIVVRYPSRAKLLEMALDPGYQASAVHRTAALATSGLIATDPWEVEV